MTPSPKQVHEYFEQNASDWDIIGFFNECSSIETYRDKVGHYLTSLELINCTENGKRREKAQELLQLYKQGMLGAGDLYACLMFKSLESRDFASHRRPLCLSDGKTRVKEWEKVHSNTQININRSTINGTVREITNGVYGTMNKVVFDVKLAPKRENQDANNDKISKRAKINGSSPAHASTPQHEENQDKNILKKVQNDEQILGSADSKMDKGTSFVPSSNFNCDEEVIDFRDVSKKDWILEDCNLSSEFRNFQQSTIQQVKEKPCLSNVMLIESTKPTYLNCNNEIWNKVFQRQISPRLSPLVISLIAEYSSMLNSFISPDKIQKKWSENFSKIAELDKDNKDDFCKSQIILRNFLLLSINNDNEDTFVHVILHDLIKEVFRNSMVELVWANSESSCSKENIIKKSDFKIMNNEKDEIIFGEVKSKDSSSVLAKKDLIKLANYQVDALNELVKKYDNKVEMISFGIWVCGARIRIYKMDMNYDGIYRMFLISNVVIPTERARFVNLIPVLEAFQDTKHRLSEVLKAIASNTSPSSLSRSSYGRTPTPSPKLVKITIIELEPKNAKLIKVREENAKREAENAERKAITHERENIAQPNLNLKWNLNPLQPLYHKMIHLNKYQKTHLIYLKSKTSKSLENSWSEDAIASMNSWMRCIGKWLVVRLVRESMRRSFNVDYLARKHPRLSRILNLLPMNGKTNRA
ncbi:1615_t:CDS:10 [Acaulospora morrowiae]|uniref:1615_t:CDS:1 n=1 Tax=Acaulospora morrowiae TaxID=94023 RepID=A0A9N9B033_9GLOM|nr:1615_t:CDS:10 [Acaulospora morrowiae]